MRNNTFFAKVFSFWELSLQKKTILRFLNNALIPNHLPPLLSFLTFQIRGTFLSSSSFHRKSSSSTSQLEKYTATKKWNKKTIQKVCIIYTEGCSSVIIVLNEITYSICWWWIKTLMELLSIVGYPLSLIQCQNTVRKRCPKSWIKNL